MYKYVYFIFKHDPEKLFETNIILYDLIIYVQPSHVNQVFYTLTQKRDPTS